MRGGHRGSLEIGFNSKLLSGEFATKISGRYIQIQVYPFSFNEYCMAARETEPMLSETELFNRYMKQGGMPFLLKAGLNESDSKQYLQDLHASIVIKDIVKRNNVRDVDLLERIIAYVMANISKTFSANSISSFFKSVKRTVAPETILNYLNYCQESYLFGKVNRLELPSKKTLQANAKFYVADHGMRQAVYGYNERDIELILENIVCVELWRRGYEVAIGRASEDTVKREFGVYYKITDNFPKYVVSMDEPNMSRDGIAHKNIREFLLSDCY